VKNLFKIKLYKNILRIFMCNNNIKSNLNCVSLHINYNKCFTINKPTSILLQANDIPKASSDFKTSLISFEKLYLCLFHTSVKYHNGHMGSK